MYIHTYTYKHTHADQNVLVCVCTRTCICTNTPYQYQYQYNPFILQVRFPGKNAAFTESRTGSQLIRETERDTVFGYIIVQTYDVGLLSRRLFHGTMKVLIIIQGFWEMQLTFIQNG